MHGDGTQIAKRRIEGLVIRYEDRSMQDFSVGRLKTEIPQVQLLASSSILHVKHDDGR